MKNGISRRIGRKMEITNQYKDTSSQEKMCTKVENKWLDNKYKKS